MLEPLLHQQHHLSSQGEHLDAIEKDMSSKDDSASENRSIHDHEASLPSTGGGMSRAEIMALQQQQSFLFPPGRGVSSIMPQNPMMVMPPEQLRYLQDMHRAEQVMMASQPSAARGAASQGPPQLPGGRMPYQVFGAPRNMPGTAQWDRGANAPFIPQDRLDPRSLLGVAQAHPLQGMLSSQSIAREDNMDMLRSMLRQQEEYLMNLKRQGGWASPPAKRQHLDSPVEQWDQQNIASQTDGYTQILAMNRSAHKPRKRHVKTFPVKLMETITEYYDETIVAWLPDGKSIVIVDPQDFCDKVLSKAFKGGKYTSFVRKLNRWGFTRLISGTGMDCFYHPLFQRNRMDLCARITCQEATSSQTSRPDIELIENQEKPSLAGIEKYFAYVNNKETVTVKVAESNQKEDENEMEMPEEAAMKKAAS